MNVPHRPTLTAAPDAPPVSGAAAHAAAHAGEVPVAAARTGDVPPVAAARTARDGQHAAAADAARTADGHRAAPATPFPTDWRWHHAHAARSLDDVAALFGARFDLSRLDRAGIDRAAARYGMRATPYYLDLARAADPSDPIWRLAVPSPLEEHVAAGERDDPIGDEAPGLHPLAGVTRRYRDRALLYPTPTCSVHCRHCFRKRMIGRPEYALSDAELDAALDWIGSQPELREVILTGGDPLTLSDARVAAILDRLGRIAHLRSVRVHTRMPVVNPYRVTDELAATLAGCRLPVLVVAHFNHPVEVTAEARAAVARLLARGVVTLNQSVLLAGINDDADVHRELLWALLAARVRPYALHHADLVPGTAHLRTSVATGLALMAALRGTVPGHALPRYLLDVPGGHGKVPLEPPWVTVLARPDAGDPGTGAAEAAEADAHAPDGGAGHAGAHAHGARTASAPERLRIRAPDGTLHVYPPSPPGASR